MTNESTKFRAAQQISERTRLRQKERTREDAEILELARELDLLSERFPRFANRINRLTYLVRFQLRPVGLKRELVRKALRESGMLGLSEIAEDTGLDEAAVITALGLMTQEIELCLRTGQKYEAPPGRKTDPIGRPLDSEGRARAAGVKLFFRLIKADTRNDGR